MWGVGFQREGCYGPQCPISKHPLTPSQAELASAGPCVSCSLVLKMLNLLPLAIDLAERFDPNLQMDI